MIILSNKRYDELIQAKKELDILHGLFLLRKECGNYVSKEANILGIPFESTSNCIYDVMERYFGLVEKEESYDEKVTKLKNEFINLDNKLQVAIGNGDYESVSKIRDEKDILVKDVFTNIVEPYIPLSFEFDLNKIKR